MGLKMCRMIPTNTFQIQKNFSYQKFDVNLQVIGNWLQVTFLRCKQYQINILEKNTKTLEI